MLTTMEQTAGPPKESTLRRDSHISVRVFVLLLGFLPTIVGCDRNSTEGGNAQAKRSLDVALEAVHPSSLGPSFAIVTGRIKDRPYGFLGSAAGLVVLEMSDVTHPNEVASLMTAGAPQSLFLLGDYLFAAGGPGSSIIDVSEPEHPVRVGFLPAQNEVRDAAFDPTRRLAVVVDFLGLSVVDLSDPATPLEIGSMRTSGAPLRATLDIARELALVVGDGDSPAETGVLRLIDISDPTRPVELGALSGSALGIAVDTTRQIALVAGRAGATTRAGSLQLVDVSNPRRPARLAAIAIPGVGFDIALDGRRNLAVVVGDGEVRGTGSLRVIDISDPGRPVDVGGLDLPSRALRVVLDADNRLALVAGGHGLIIVRY